MEPLTDVSLEVLDAFPTVFVIGMAAGCIVVLAAGAVVSCFKALIRMIGR